MAIKESPACLQNPCLPIKKWEETDLFPAVRMNNIKWITSLGKEGADINALDVFKRNALQAALYRKSLEVNACITLIQLGIDLEHESTDGETALGHVVYFYKKDYTTESTNHHSLNLFRSMVEGGAHLDGMYRFAGIDSVSIREEIRSHPEMESIVQEVFIQRANKVFEAIGGPTDITRLVCEKLGCAPRKNWSPPNPI